MPCGKSSAAIRWTRCGETSMPTRLAWQASDGGMTSAPISPRPLAAQRMLLILVVTAMSLAVGMSRIHDLDFWWHLQAGHQIALTHSIPHTDTFSYTAYGHEYIDHEWLFQVVLYAIWAAFGPLGIALLVSLLVAVTMSIVALYAVRRGARPMVAVGLVGLAIAGGVSRINERPELFSILFVVLTFVIADTYRSSGNCPALLALPLTASACSHIHSLVIVR